MKSRQRSKILLLALFLGTSSLWWSCQKSDDKNQVEPRSVAYDASLPQSWMYFAYDAVKRQGWFALDASRLYAYMAITAHESMVHSLPNSRSMAGQLQGLNNLPQPVPGKTYDWGIVLCQAMPQLFEELMPAMVDESRNRMTTIARNQENSLVDENKLSQQVIDDSKQFADELAEAIILWSRKDNRIGMQNLVYNSPSRVGNPQYWDGSTLGQSFMMPYWWTSRPFVIQSYNICPVEGPLPYSEDPNSNYYKEVKEVYDASFDPAKIFIGRYWANNPLQSGTPAGAWLGIANQLVDQYDLDLATTLKMYVLMTVGTRDAFIACWHLKYKYNLQRPVSYIRNVMGQPSWSSAVPTPPYPDYTSGTSTNAGISSELLTRLFGVRSFTDTQHTDKQDLGVREFDSFKQAGVEAFHSRIFGGVHMRRACELGFVQGECIGEYLWANLEFSK